MSSSMLQAVLRDAVMNAVRELPRYSGIQIDGVEVTQAIQYRSADAHLTDPADRGPDNSVRLVADKPARVRVYVRNHPELVNGVVGTVTMQRQRYGAWVDTGALMQQWPASVSAEPAPNYAAERRSSAASLNFVIPAAAMRGRLRLTVQVRVSASGQTASTFVDVDASLLQTLRIRGIPVQFIGPDANNRQLRLPATTLANFQATVATTLRLFPVSQTPDISLAGLMTWSEPLLGDIVNGACPQPWNDLLFWLSLIRIADGNRADALYYALLPSGTPIGGASGCGGGGAGVGSGTNGDGMAMAHELGHVLGLAHGPCGLGAGDAGDPNYPAYEPYDRVAAKMASIGEYGMDVSNGTIYPPSAVSDFMSYCGPSWMSLYHHQKLLLHPKLNPTHVVGERERLPAYLDEQYHGPSIFDRPDPPPPWVGRRINVLVNPDPVRLVVVTGVLRDEKIDIRSVLRIETRPTQSGERIPGTFVELLDANFSVLQRVPLRRMITYASCGCGGGCDGAHNEPPSGLVQALVPDEPNTFSMRVVRDEKELWSRQAPSVPLTVSNLHASVNAESVYIRWLTVASDEYDLERVVRWSADDGLQWQALAVKLDDDVAVVPVSTLTCGVALIQVIVSDGFHSVTSESVRVDIPRRAPHAAILWPAAGAAVSTNEAVRLWGSATGCDGQPRRAEDMHWYLDGDRVGTGTELWVTLPDWEGEHRATLKAIDGEFATEVTVVFESNCNGRQPYRTPGGRSSSDR